MPCQMTLIATTTILVLRMLKTVPKGWKCTFCTMKVAHYFGHSPNAQKKR